MVDMLVPLPFSGTLKDFKEQQHLHKGYEWLNALSNPNVYFSLFQRWPQHNLPKEYNLHIVSFHLEAVDVNWLEKQSKRITGEIIVLFDGSSNNYSIPKVRFLPYYYWHIQLDRIFNWFSQTFEKNITHKASAICNRIQTNKLLVFTALAEHLDTGDCMLVLRDWLEEDNIYKITARHNDKLGDLYDIFFKSYYGKEYTIDNFTNEQNYQKHTANPNQLYLQNCAIHFTNESFHTTGLHLTDSPYNSALWSYPGPFITEKTLKCIAGCTAFIPVGQYNTYGTLQELGFEFDYGFDCSFDSIKHDGDRLNAIVNLIETFKDIDSNTLYQMTKESTEKNYHYVKDGVFYREVEKLNSYTAEQVIEHIKQTA
jgi:hypothetical protein